MKSWKLALLSFVAGGVLAIGPIAYACDSEIWVQDTGDCHVYNRYVLTSTGGDS
jgi:hypothetical protein